MARMSDLDAQFEAAAAAASGLATDPGTAAKLRLYGLFKQATSGDVTGRRPGFTDPVGRAKYDAWAAVTGTGRDEARRAYIALVDELRGASA
jgi:diazepam-binding inhibitor (GABA receptor modulating acyl-CoA-binding protein)